MPGPFGRLWVQITLGPVLVIALVGSAMLWRVNTDLHEQAKTRFADQVKLSVMQVEDRVESEVQQRVVSATILADQQQFVGAIQVNNINSAVQIATAHMTRTSLAQAGASGIRVYGPNGNLMLRAEAPQNSAQRAVPAEVMAVLRSGRAEGFVRLDETMGLTMSGISPILGGDGRPLDAVEAVTSFDRTFAAAAAASVANTNVAVISGGRVTAKSDADVQLDPAAITDDFRRRAKESPAHLAFADREHVVGLATYRDAAGTLLGDIYLAIDHELINETVLETRGSILRTMLVAIFLATGAAWLFGWLALRPMQPLLVAAGRLQQNDLESPVPASGPVELRRLGEAMEDMRLAIRQSREALQSANRDLASRVSTSDASLSEVTQDLHVMQTVVAQLAGESARGLPSMTEELLRLEWADGAFIALATEEGALSTAASAGLPPGAASAALEVIEKHMALSPLVELGIEDTAAQLESQRLPSWLIGGLAVAPMQTPDGTAGVVVITSVGAMSLTPQRRELLRSIAHEVTATLERSELADEVEENRRVAEAVLREMADGVVVVDHLNIGQICNPAAARLLGLTRADIIGHPTNEWLPVAPATLETLRLRAGEARNSTPPVLVDSGGHQLAVTAGPFPDPDPSRAGVILLIRDLSAEAEAERVKRYFVSMVGHELRTPLTLIRTTIDLLHGHHAGGLNATQERIVEVLRQNSERLMTLTSDLLDMSALDSGRMQIVPASVDLIEIVRRAVRAAAGAAGERKHQLRLVLPEDANTVMVWADTPRVEQVLSNLISNAIKYTPPNGEIDVRIEGGRAFASVAVADSGIGIPPEEQAGLFEKFYRTSAGRRTTGGTGLGLAIARSIVELHGGEIVCDSDGQTGTTFTFTLPRRPL